MSDTLNIVDLRINAISTTCLSTQAYGEFIASYWRLDQLEQSAKRIQVIFPDNADEAVRSEFFKGLLGEAIPRFTSAADFYTKYCFVLGRESTQLLADFVHRHFYKPISIPIASSSWRRYWEVA